MKLVMITSEGRGPWRFDQMAREELLWEECPTATCVEPDGERWNVVTVESAREDYDVRVPSC